MGTESAFTVLARAQQLAASGQDIINLGIGQPDFRTPEHIVQAGIKALQDGHHGYTPANGLPVLREAVAADLEKRHGAQVNPDNVIVVPGGKPTMFFAVLMFGEEGAEIMYPNPGFPIYESVIKYSGATPVPISLKEENGFAFDADTVLSQITERTRLIIINSPQTLQVVSRQRQRSTNWWLVWRNTRRLRFCRTRFIHRCYMMGANTSAC